MNSNRSHSNFCPVCKMHYVRGLRENEKQHYAYHDRFVNGVRALPLKNECVLWQEEDHRITLVTALSPISMRRRAENVAAMANSEMHYEGGIYYAKESPNKRDVHLFLYHVRDRIIGLSIFEKRCHAWKCRWISDCKPDCEPLNQRDKLKWSVAFIWVHEKVRKKGIARRLFTQAITHLSIDPQGVGWLKPHSEAGLAFVKSLYPNEFFVVK
jgi:hypothetical protein